MHQLANLKNWKEFFSHACYNFSEVGSICKGTPQSECLKHINSRKIIQSKDRVMPSSSLCLKGKPKLSTLTIRHLLKHDWHVTKAVVCSTFINKRFYDRNSEVCLFVEKDNQINSLHASLKRYKTLLRLSVCLPSKCVIPIIKWSIFLVKCFSHFSNLQKTSLNRSFPYKRQLLFAPNITLWYCQSYFQQIPLFRIGWRFSLLFKCRVESKIN